MMAIPIRMIAPTMTQVCETPTKIAAIANPMIRTMNPIRYVLNEDMAVPVLDFGGESSKYRARKFWELFYDYRQGVAGGPAGADRLPLGYAVPTSRNQRVIRYRFNLARDERRGSPVATKARGFAAVGVPDVEGRAEDVSAGVVHEVAAQVLVAEKDLDVAGEREDPGIGGDDTVAGLTSATRFTLDAILGVGDRSGERVL